MNEFLAELYGTRDAIGTEDSSDVEKLAEAQILDDVLQSEGIDVDDLDDGTILKLAHEIFGDDSELVKSASSEEDEAEETEEEEAEEEAEETSEEKTAEADMLGRIMAHSMVQELGQIELEKDAGAVTESIKGVGKAIGGAAKGAKDKVTAPFKKAVEGLKGAKKTYEAERFGVIKGGKKGKKPSKSGTKAEDRKMVKTRKSAGTPSQSRTEAALATLKQSKAARRAAGAATGLAGLSAVGAGAGGHKLVTASVIDDLAEKRAYAILEENGIGFEQETEQDIEVKLASSVEERAWAMLAAAGWTQDE